MPDFDKRARTWLDASGICVGNREAVMIEYAHFLGNQLRRAHDEGLGRAGDIMRETEEDAEFECDHPKCGHNYTCNACRDWQNSYDAIAQARKEAGE